MSTKKSPRNLFWLLIGFALRFVLTMISTKIATIGFILLLSMFIGLFWIYYKKQTTADNLKKNTRHLFWLLIGFILNAIFASFAKICFIILLLWFGIRFWIYYKKQ